MVATVEVELDEISLERRWQGVLLPLNKVHLQAPVSGMLAELSVVEGQIVNKGDVLAQVESPELLARRSILAQRIESLKGELQRWERLAAATAAGPGEVQEARLRLLESDEQLEEIEARIARGTLRSPVNGRIVQLSTAHGASIEEGSPILWIEDHNSVGMRLRIAAIEARYFDNTDNLKLIHSNIEHHEISGITVKADEANPNFLNAEVRISGVEQFWPSVADLVYSQHRDAIIVPWTSVARDADQHWLAVVDAESGLISRRPVVLGSGHERGIEVREGLAEGELVVRFEPRSHPEGRQVNVHRRP